MGKQQKRVLDFMERFGSISRIEAVLDLGIVELPARICELRKAGYPIDGETIWSTNRFGEKVHFVRYSMSGTGDGQ